MSKSNTKQAGGAPLLPTEALQKIESAERLARKEIGESIRPYTPGNPAWRCTREDILEGGHRVIDHLCSFAKIIFDAHAKAYLQQVSEKSSYSRALAGRVVALTRNGTRRLWTAWFFVSGILPPHSVDPSERDTSIEIPAPRQLANRGYRKVRFLFASSLPLDPQLAAGLENLCRRYDRGVETVLKERRAYWIGRMNRGVPRQVKVHRERIVEEYRQRNGLTMQDLARKLGMSSTAIYGIINDDRSRYKLEKRAKFLKDLNLTEDGWNRTDFQA
jgi:hypothetical protein